MQLAELSVENLFGRYNHTIPLPTSSEDSTSPSVVIIHGPNGVGKTTLLQMLDGIMRLDFDPFRRVPFRRASLKFNSGDYLAVEKLRDGTLKVNFQNHEVYLDKEEKGPAKIGMESAVEDLRIDFVQFTTELSFDFLDESRIIRQKPWDTDLESEWIRNANISLYTVAAQKRAADRQRHGVGPRSEQPSPLGQRVRRFMQEAQVDYRQFFATTEPDLFPKIIENLSNPTESLEPPEVLEKKLTRVHELEVTHSRLGMGADRWSYEQLITTVRKLKSAPDNNALVVLNTYTEFLESRAEARQLVAERLLTFEEVMREFFEDKRVRISRRSGIEIESFDGGMLQEWQLSSGEYQLLYLMVAALTTRRRGTIIAIDEPELSIHIAWQRKLVRNILRCASRATPQLILATHSPDIATDYAERMVNLTADKHAS